MQAEAKSGAHLNYAIVLCMRTDSTLTQMDTDHAEHLIQSNTSAELEMYLLLFLLLIVMFGILQS